MKVARWMSTGALPVVLFFGASMFMQGQEQRDDAKPAQPDNRPEAAQPAQDESSPREAKPSKQNEDKAARQDNNNNDKSARGKEDKQSSRDDDKAARQEENESREARGKESAQNAKGAGEHRGGRIPDDKFHATFGHQHSFRMHRPTVVQGHPMFQYGGYSFVLVDAWPMDWVDSDDYYIDYVDDAYFLFDLAHPGVRIAIVVEM